MIKHTLIASLKYPDFIDMKIEEIEKFGTIKKIYLNRSAVQWISKIVNKISGENALGRQCSRMHPPKKYRDITIEFCEWVNPIYACFDVEYK